MQTISDHRPVRMVLSRMRFLHIWICAFLADSYGGFGKKNGVPENHPNWVIFTGKLQKPMVWDLGCPYFRKSPCGFLWQRGYHKIPLKHGGPSIIFQPGRPHSRFLECGVPDDHGQFQDDLAKKIWWCSMDMWIFQGAYEILTSSWHPAGLLVFLLMEICAISVNESLAKKEILSFKDANNMMLTEERPPSWSCSGCHTYEALWTQGSAISFAACWGCENEVSPHNGCFSGHRIPNQWIQG